MTPTDEQINRRAAEVLGWKLKLRHANGGETWITPDGCETYKQRIPKFCNDRNALPELLQRVVNEHREYEFESAMKGDTDCINAYLLPARAIVEAALVALRAWPDEWDEE